MKRLTMVVSGMMFAVGMVGMVMAGSMDSPGDPGSAASKMPGMGDIYTYLTTGTPAPTPGTGFTEPSSSPAGTGHTLTEIYAAVATPFPQCDATVSDVKSGKKFFCTVAGSWGLKTGTKVGQQYCTLLKTGQTSVYRTGDDGSKSKGKAFSYTDSGSGLSVTDNVTGLMWAKSGTAAGCRSSIIWSNAIDWAVGLKFDGYSDWRMPNITELQSILVRDASLGSPYINKTWFPNTPVAANFCMSSTAVAANASYIIHINLTVPDGSFMGRGDLYSGSFVRAVRGGE